jgi:hypothetical protein
MKQKLLHAAASLALVSLAACSMASGGASYEAKTASASPAPEMPMQAPGAMGELATIASADEGSAPSGDKAISFKSEESVRRGEQSMGFPGAPPPPPPPPPAKPVAPLPPGDPKANAVAGEVAALRAPLLVYTAQITVAVFEVAASLAQVEALGRDLGGFLARRDDNTITIRIPAARFDEAVKRLEAVGDMIHRNVTAEDVTEEFRDLEVRLRSAHAVQERLTQLLAKAAKVEESVLIERELDRVTGEIDRIEGRMKFLRDRATFSTITVTFASKAKEQVGQGPFRLPSPWLQQLGLGRLLQL